MPSRKPLKICLLADIRGNYSALEKVLRSAVKSGVERLVVAGDLIGYYSVPFQVFELLAKLERQILRGNVEDILENACSAVGFPGWFDELYEPDCV